MKGSSSERNVDQVNQGVELLLDVTGRHGELVFFELFAKMLDPVVGELGIKRTRRVGKLVAELEEELSYVSEQCIGHHRQLTSLRVAGDARSMTTSPIDFR